MNKSEILKALRESCFSREDLRDINHEVVTLIKDYRQEVKQNFRRGQLVQFFDKRRYVQVQGRIEKIMPVNCRIRTTHGVVYTASPELLKEWDGKLANGTVWDGKAPNTKLFDF
jgi:hypothetical protein